jgi:transcriptional antiterminator Rof (Rho-off)
MSADDSDVLLRSAIMATATAEKRSTDFRDRVPMSHDQAVAVYLGEISNPRSAGEQDLREAMEILGLSSADYHRDVNLQKQIEAINDEITTVEQGENNEADALTLKLKDCAAREQTAFNVWNNTKQEYALLMVQLSAANSKTQRLKTDRTQLLLAKRAAEDRLRQPAQSAQAPRMMTFPA